MLRPRPRCPDCEQDMERGYILDPADSRPTPSAWHPGAPGDQTAPGQSEPDLQIPLTAYRCASCGVIKHYAWRQET